MRRLATALIIISLMGAGMTACKPGLLPTDEAGKPKVTLERVEVASSFPWVDLPARTPLALGFVFNINNPSGYNVMLDNMKFAFSFEVTPDYFVEMNVPVSYDRIYFAAEYDKPVSNRQYHGFSGRQRKTGGDPGIKTSGTEPEAVPTSSRTGTRRSVISPLASRWPRAWPSSRPTRETFLFPSKASFQ